MSDLYCDISEWTKFDVDVLNFVQKEMPVETKKFMRREGGRLKTTTKKIARARIHKKTGNYLKGVKNTRAWRNAKGDYGVKVRGDHKIAPHTHLIEYGHRVVTRRGRDTGYRSKDFNIYRDANTGFQGKFFNDAHVFTGQMMENGLKGK